MARSATGVLLHATRHRFAATLSSSWGRKARGSRLLRRHALGAAAVGRDIGDGRHHGVEMAREGVEAGTTGNAPLVHVEPAVDLDLDGVEARGRPAVMFGDEATGIGL